MTRLAGHLVDLSHNVLVFEYIQIPLNVASRSL